MKKIYIVVAALIAVGVAIALTASDDMSTYSTFSEAMQSEKKIKVVGQFAKDKEMYYEPQVDPNYFSFYVRDNEGTVKKVVHNTKPQDIELSEQIVMTGKMEGDEFHASHILTKCPSKYKDEEIALKKKEG